MFAYVHIIKKYVFALATFYCLKLRILHFKGGYECKESSADINHFLQHVEAKFSDVLIPLQQIVTQEYLGKGMKVYHIYVPL